MRRTARRPGPAAGYGAGARLPRPATPKCALTRPTAPRLEVADGDQEGVVGGEVAAVVLDRIVEREPGDLADSAPRVAR